MKERSSQGLFAGTIFLIVVLILAAGCTGPGDSPAPFRAGDSPDPESGIVRWIDAVNERDYGAVYDLMPGSKRAGISREQYIRFNRDNPSPFLASGPVVTDYFILDKNTEGLNATIKAGLQTSFSGSAGNEPPRQETVFFTFEESFEENEWKVWAR